MTNVMEADTQETDTTLDRVAERLTKLPALGSLPSSEGMASLHLADVVAITGRLPKGCESPRQMFISWPVELSQRQMAEMWRGVEGVTAETIAAVYRDPMADVERQQYQFQQIKESSYPDYGDPQFRLKSILRQIGNIHTRLDTINARWRDATESFTAYGQELFRVTSNSGLARLGRMEVDYLNLLTELHEQLDILQGTGNRKPVGEEAISAAERRLAKFRQQHQQSNTSLTIINDNRTQIVNATPVDTSQSREVLNGNPPSTPRALPTPGTSATNI